MTTHPATPATLRSVAFPRTGVFWDVVLVCLGAGLISGAAQIAFHIPGTPVPVTGQTFAVLLVGASLGSARGGSSAMLYLVLGLIAPVYASGHEGWSIITGSSGGYLVSYPIVAALTGYLAERRWDRKFSSAVGAMLTGNVVIYLIALPWLAVVLNTDFEKTMQYGLYPFIPGDMLKLYLAAAALPAAWTFVNRSRRD
jgi:biotin transport system substrate-specific component